MVQKAVGWLLKETYPNKPTEVLSFLKPWKARAPRLVLRLARSHPGAEVLVNARERLARAT